MNLLHWLLAPLSGAASHGSLALVPWVQWHARGMVLAWGFLLPTGALAARYFKLRPDQRWPEELDRRAWWHAHLGLQWAGVLAMSLGAGFAWGHGGGASVLARWHAGLGTAVLALAALQVAAALARGSKGGPTKPGLRGDHYDMTARRRVFECLHKGVGWLAVVAAPAVIGLGLWLVDAPRWMPLALLFWWLALAGAAWRWQRQGRCVDTYQAIWGPDPAHPGNQRRPIGWGVRRPVADRTGRR